MKNKKITSIVTSGMIASALIFSFGTGSAFANGDGTDATDSVATEANPTIVEINSEQTDTPAEVEAGTTSEVEDGTTSDEPAVEEGTTSDESAVDESTDESEVVDADVPEQDEAEVEAEAPSLVPGDFFYFVKLMAEKVRYAFTFDDYKEAKLLAEFAAERIAEANALLADGKTDEATALLKDAIATQEQSAEKLPEAEEGTEEETSADTVSDVTEVQSHLAHNIDALLAALEHVKNPTAQKALMKNIQKSFAKLEKKAAKLEEKDAKFAEKMSKLEGKVASGETTEDVATKEKSKHGKGVKKHKQEEEATEVEQETTEVTEAPETTETTETSETTQMPAAPQHGKSAAAKEKHNETVNKGVEKKQAAAKKVEEKKNDASQKAEEAKNNNGKGNGKGNGNH